MKREYVKPEITVIEIGPITMMAASGNQSPETGAKPYTGTDWETDDGWGNSYNEGEDDLF